MRHAFCSVQRSDGVDETIEIPDVMFNTGRLRQRNFYDDILVALTRQPLQQVDAAVSHGVCIRIFTFDINDIWIKFMVC